MSDGKRAFELLEKIGFVRMGGSAEELKAANILLDEIKACGVEGHLESFDVADSETVTATLEVLEPYKASYTVTAYHCCADTPAEGLEADFAYVGNATEADLVDVKGKVALVNGFLRVPTAKRLIKAGVAGIITMSGTLLDREEETDLFTRKLRDILLEACGGNVPAVNLRISDGFELVSKGAARLRVTIKSKPLTLHSNNVVAEIKGTKYPEQVISFGAHYDSVEFSAGVYDNGAGSVVEMELLRHFAAHPPLRTLRFMWYGCEEIGLEGSKAYVEAHKDELKQHLLMVNIDVGGPVLGFDLCKVMGTEEMVALTDGFMKIKGYPMEVSQSIYSSDSIPFSENGVPALNFCRDGAPGASFIHCRNDVIKYLSPEALGNTTRYLLDYCDTLVNAAVFPIERKIPDKVVEEIEKYLYKKEREEAKQEGKAE